MGAQIPLMGTEYYIVKPSKKQIFYLGRRISYLDGLVDYAYTQKAQFPEWECWEDVVHDFQENASYFLERDLTVGQVWDFCQEIYEFCDDKVYLDNDCSENFNVWKDWKEIDKLSDLISIEEKWCELALLVPEKYWVTEGKVLKEYETVKNFIEKESKNEKRFNSNIQQ